MKIIVNCISELKSVALQLIQYKKQKNIICFLKSILTSRIPYFMISLKRKTYKIDIGFSYNLIIKKYKQSDCQRCKKVIFASEI